METRLTQLTRGPTRPTDLRNPHCTSTRNCEGFGGLVEIRIENIPRKIENISCRSDLFKVLSSPYVEQLESFFVRDISTYKMAYNTGNFTVRKRGDVLVVKYPKLGYITILHNITETPSQTGFRVQRGSEGLISLSQSSCAILFDTAGS